MKSAFRPVPTSYIGADEENTSHADVSEKRKLIFLKAQARN